MRLEKKYERWQCLSASFAMALGCSQEEIYKAVGHDGGEILWDDLAEPECRRSFHIQEMIRVACARGKAVTPIEVWPILASRDGRRVPIVFGDSEKPSNIDMIIEVIEGNTGVLEVLTKSGRRHAVAFEDGRIYDPDGGDDYKATEQTLHGHGLMPLCAWVVT